MMDPTICCGSLLNSILKTYRRNFFKHSDLFSIQQHLKCCRIFGVFFTHKLIKNVLCNKSKNPSICFFICMSSMYVQLFTAFEEAVLKLYVPW